MLQACISYLCMGADVPVHWRLRTSQSNKSEQFRWLVKDKHVTHTVLIMWLNPGIRTEAATQCENTPISPAFRELKQEDHHQLSQPGLNSETLSQRTRRSREKVTPAPISFQLGLSPQPLQELTGRPGATHLSVNLISRRQNQETESGHCSESLQQTKSKSEKPGFFRPAHWLI